MKFTYNELVCLKDLAFKSRLIKEARETNFEEITRADYCELVTSANELIQVIWKDYGIDCRIDHIGNVEIFE